jgi:hypothetical protein
MRSYAGSPSLYCPGSYKLGLSKAAIELVASFTNDSCWIPGSSLVKFDVIDCFSRPSRGATDAVSLEKAVSYQVFKSFRGVCKTPESNKSLQRDQVTGGATILRRQGC